MLPAHQGLHARHLAAHIHLGLHVKPQLLRADGVAQVPLHLKALGRHRAHALLKKGGSGATGVLGPVQGGARAPHGSQRRVVCPLRVQGQAHAQSQLRLFTGVTQCQRVHKGLLDLVGKRQRAAACHGGVDAQVVQHNAKLVPRHTNQQIVRAQQLGQPQGHGAQQPVAHLAASGIVEVGEPVQIQQQQDMHIVARALMAGLQAGQPLDEHGPVGQAGERVVMREPVNLLRGPLAVAHVLLELDIVGDAPVWLADRGHHHGFTDHRAIFAQIALLARPGLATLQGLAHALPLRGPQAVGGHLTAQPAQHFMAGIAGARQKGIVHKFDAPVQIGDDRALRALLHHAQQLAQFGVAGLQVLGHGLGLMHPPEVTFAREQRSCRREPHNACQVHRIRPSVVGAHGGQRPMQISPQEKCKQTACDRQQTHGRAAAQQPATQHDQNGINKQVGAVDAAIAGRHQRHDHPHTPHQQPGSQHLAPQVQRHQGGGPYTGHAQVQRQAVPLGLLFAQQEQGHQSAHHHGHPASHLHHAAHAGVVVVDDRRHRKGCPGGMQNKRCILTRSGDESQSTPQGWRGYATRRRDGHWEPGEQTAGPPAPALNSAGEARLANCAGRWSRPRAPAGAAG